MLRGLPGLRRRPGPFPITFYTHFLGVFQPKYSTAPGVGFPLLRAYSFTPQFLTRIALNPSWISFSILHGLDPQSPHRVFLEIMPSDQVEHLVYQLDDYHSILWE